MKGINGVNTSFQHSQLNVLSLVYALDACKYECVHQCVLAISHACEHMTTLCLGSIET